MTSQQEGLPELVRYIQALGVPMLTLAASFIAYMQWRTADQKVQVDLFDRRMQICTYLDNFKKSVRSLKRIYAGDVQKLYDLDIKIRFLFDNKIHESYLQMAFYADQYYKLFDSIPGYPPPRGFLLLEPANVTMANEIQDLIEEMHFYSRIDRRRPAFMNRKTVNNLKKYGLAAQQATLSAINSFFNNHFALIAKPILFFIDVIEITINVFRRIFRMPPIVTIKSQMLNPDFDGRNLPPQSDLKDVPASNRPSAD